MKYLKIMAAGVSMVLLFFITSCNKMLDIDTTDYLVEPENYYATKKDMDASLRGIYLIMNKLYGDYLQGRMGLEADEGFLKYGFDDGTVGYYDVSANDYKVLFYWRNLYEGINLANTLLENIDKPVMDSADRAHIKGQALFLRGYYYFMLVNKFGDVPLVLKATTSGDVGTIQVARSKAGEVYGQVIADMTAAADLVRKPDAVSGGGEITQTAVWGMLARVCIYMAGAPVNDTEKYETAAFWAAKVMSSGQHFLNPSYQQVFINYAQDLYDIKESILEVEFYGNGSGIYSAIGGYVGLNNGIANADDYNLGYSRGLVHPTTWLYGIYSAQDLRRDWNIPNFYWVGNPAQKSIITSPAYYRYCGKYRREYETLLPKSSAKTPQNAPLLRYSDVLLMYAEALNEVNKMPTEAAYEALNKVRRRAFGYDPETPNPAVDLSGYAYEDFKEEIMNERGRELCFEGLRKNDLVRWGLFYANMKTVLQNTPVGTTSVLRDARKIYTNASARDVLWPVPAYEMNLNKKLVQNNGW